jgi:hypothetical protein
VVPLRGARGRRRGWLGGDRARRRSPRRGSRVALADTGIETGAAPFTHIGQPRPETRSIPTGPFDDGVAKVTWISLAMTGIVGGRLRDRLVDALFDRFAALLRRSENDDVDMPIFKPDGDPINIVKLRRHDRDDVNDPPT